MLRVTPQNLRELGWHRVTDALAIHATTPPGVAAAARVGPLQDRAATELCLSRVAALQRLLDRGADAPLGGVPDITVEVFRRAAGAVLTADEIFLVARLAEAAVEVRAWLRHHAEALAPFEALLAALPDLNLLATELLHTFDELGRVRDDASPELATARGRLIGLHRNMKERLERFIAQSQIAEVLQDGFYTQREDRYVVPVMTSFQGQVPGIIHGTSNSGETVFIEPHAFVEANNAVKVAEAEVRAALEAVLRERTAWIAGEGAALEAALEALVELDLLQARARLGHAMGANIPELSSDGTLRLLDARNPYLLLKGAKVVPNTIEIPSDKRFLVVTGPNTGGKTVTLSTVGMCYLMFAAGMPIPVADGSIIAPMRSLAALIGDAQDLERDLSTFSGHLRAIQSLLDAVEEGSLVLLDEIATGTEPAQGAALAIAVLEALAARGGRGLVTTHYERLKTLPFEDARFANAAVGLDPVTLAPTFVLEGGRPGTSNPFEIALHLGFPPRIIERARAITTRETGGLSEAFGRIAEAEAAAKEARRAYEAARIEAEAESRRLAAERARLERLAAEEVMALHAEVKAELRAVRDGLAARRRDLVKAAAEQRAAARPVAAADIEAIDAERAAVDAEALRVQDALPSPASPPAGEAPRGAGDGGPLDDAAVVPGAAVWLTTLQKGARIQEVRGDRVALLVGDVSVTARRRELRRLSGVLPAEGSKVPKQKTIRVVSEVPRAPELDLDDVRTPPPRTDAITADLRGQRREDVQPVVEPLLDRAFREQNEAIWVIHGHGTGAMRDEVREFLARSPYVLGWRPGRRNEGGDGVTIAFLHRV